MNVDEAYARCAEITNAQAKNFSYGIRLLPPPKRAALSAVYALARRVDDIGDGDLPADAKRAALAKVRAELDGRPGAGDDPVLVAIDDAARRYELPMEEVKRFRQLHSRTPGHPEVGMTPGVETTTGPLGQGLGELAPLPSPVAAARFRQLG